MCEKVLPERLPLPSSGKTFFVREKSKNREVAINLFYFVLLL